MGRGRLIRLTQLTLIAAVAALSATVRAQPAGSGGGGPAGQPAPLTGTGTAYQAPYWTGASTLGSAAFDSYVIGASGINAAVFKNSAGVATRIEVWPQSTDKPDEGAAATPGTIAWAEAQLTGGGEIFLHAGQYDIGTTIVMNVDGTTLRCADPQATLLKAKTNLNSTILQVGWAGAKRQAMNVYNCGFNGNPINQSTSGTLIALKDVVDTHITGNYFRYWKTKGMTIGCSTGVFGAPQCLQMTIDGNLFFAGGGSGNTSGSAIEVLPDSTTFPITDSRIVDNDIGGDTTDGDRASAWLKFGNGTTTNLTGWDIQRNHIYGYDRGSCIEIDDPGSALWTISNNTLETCTQAIKWKGSSTGQAGQGVVANNKMYGFGTRCTAGSNGVGFPCSKNTDCGTSGACASAGPNVFDFDRTLRNIIIGNYFKGRNAGVTAYIALRDSAAGGGANHNVVADNAMDFTAGNALCTSANTPFQCCTGSLTGTCPEEKGITIANASNNNKVSDNRCRGIGGAGGGTCVDGGSITNNTFMANVCNNICTANEINIPASASSSPLYYLPVGGCNAATPGSSWDLPATNAPGLTCDAAGRAVAGFDATTDESMEIDIGGPLQTTYTTAAITLMWYSSATTGDVKWEVSMACWAPGGAFTTETYTTTCINGVTVPGTANTLVMTTQNVSLTGCVAGNFARLKINRDANNSNAGCTGTDSNTVDALLAGVSIKGGP